MTELQAAKEHLEHVMLRGRGLLLVRDSVIGQEFDAAYVRWIRARWDTDDPWVRRVWKERP